MLRNQVGILEVVVQVRLYWNSRPFAYYFPNAFARKTISNSFKVGFIMLFVFAAPPLWASAMWGPSEKMEREMVKIRGIERALDGRGTLGWFIFALRPKKETNWWKFVTSASSSFDHWDSRSISRHYKRLKNSTVAKNFRYLELLLHLHSKIIVANLGLSFFRYWNARCW